MRIYGRGAVWRPSQRGVFRRMALVRICLCMVLKAVSKHGEVDVGDMYKRMITVSKLWRRRMGHAHVLNRQRILPYVARPLSVWMVMCGCSKIRLTGILDARWDIL